MTTRKKFLVDVSPLSEKLRKFADERDWGKFHTPKNLAMALSVEVSELVEIFQWLSEGEAMQVMEKKSSQVEDELADILSYLVRISDVLGVDLSAAIERKMAKNAAKYPVELSKGRATKYDDL